MKVLKTANGIQLVKLGARRALQEGYEYGIKHKDDSDVDFMFESVATALEWLYPEWSARKGNAVEFFGMEEAQRLGLV